MSFLKTTQEASNHLVINHLFIEPTYAMQTVQWHSLRSYLTKPLQGALFSKIPESGAGSKGESI